LPEVSLHPVQIVSHPDNESLQAFAPLRILFSLSVSLFSFALPLALQAFAPLRILFSLSVSLFSLLFSLSVSVFSLYLSLLSVPLELVSNFSKFPPMLPP
jgi:hypothetical protein